MDALVSGLGRGNVHPLFVHFPIALWYAAALFCGFGALRSRADVFAAGRWVLYLGTISGVLAAATGLWAAESMGHDSPGHDFVHVHRNWMIASWVLAALTTLTAFLRRKRNDVITRWSITGALLIVCGLTAIGADRGAQLVYEYGMGVSTSPHSESSGSGNEHTH